MPARRQNQAPLSRARSPDQKADVRAAFISAGRRLFADGDPSTVSLRRIAAEAGYSAGTIYRYFFDQQELFYEIRAEDMQASSDHLAKLISSLREPASRVHALFVGTADYWLAHMDAFIVLFPAPRSGATVLTGAAGGEPFGRSAVVRRSLELYRNTVAELFDTLAQPPMPAPLAADLLIAAVHGTIVFPCMTRTMDWSDTRLMVDGLVTTVIRQWTTGAKPHPSATRRRSGLTGRPKAP